MGWFGRSRSEKYADAFLKVAANLLELSTEAQRADHAPLVLRSSREDFRLRYVAFCLGTAYYFSGDENTLDDVREGELEAWRSITQQALSEEDPLGFFTGHVDRTYCVQQACGVLDQTVQGWKDLAERTRRAGVDREGIEMICKMLHAAESQNPSSREDLDRLFPLATWYRGMTSSIATAVNQLAR